MANDLVSADGYRTERARDFAEHIEDNVLILADWLAEDLYDDERAEVIASLRCVIGGFIHLIDNLETMGEELGGALEIDNVDDFTFIAKYLDRCRLYLQVDAEEIQADLDNLLYMVAERIEE